MTAALLSPAARRDLIAAIAWIARDEPSAARAFRLAVSRAAEQIGRHPECGSVRPEYAEPPFRFLALAAFPYVIVYNSARKPPLIARVLHGARDLEALMRSN